VIAVKRLHGDQVNAALPRVASRGLGVRWLREVVQPAVCLLLACLSPVPIAAQAPLRPAAAAQNWVITGYVFDPSGPVAAADVLLFDSRDGEPSGARPFTRAETEEDGRFSLSAPAGAYTLVIQRLGYGQAERSISLRAGEQLSLEIELEPQALQLEGVGVAAERSRERRRFEETAGITVREISQEELKLVPGFAEADPIRAVEVLPGVVSTSDFSSSFHVRGGSADQNLILLDGTPIFSPFHLGGFFSVFNADMVDRAELASGGFPAQFGGRVSSVLSVESDPGDGSFGVDAGVSLLATRVAMKGGAPQSVRSALGLSDLRWRVSARRSYIDALLAPVTDFPYRLQDLQGVLEVGVGARDRIRFTGYTGDDILDLANVSDDGFPLKVDWRWGNDVAGLRWTRLLDRGTLTTNASTTRFGTGLRFPDFADTDFASNVRQDAIRSDLDLNLREGVRFGTGVAAERLDYRNRAETGGTVFQEGLGDGTLLSAYLQGEFGAPGRWLAEAGLRLDQWLPEPGDAMTTLSPRVSLKRFFGGGRWAAKGSVGRYTQFLHSLRDEELPLGLDIWVLSGARAPQVISDQVQVGVEAFLNDDWNVSAEAYLRDFDGVVTFNTADSPNDPFDDILDGTGRSWGADLFVRRSGEGLTGWLALSFVKAQRTFDDVLSPEFGVADITPQVTYSPIFDRRVDLDLVLQLPAYRGWTSGLRFNFGTGTPFTRPVAGYATYQPRFINGGGRYEWDGDPPSDDPEADGDGGGFAVVLGPRNAERYPLYHRLDFSLRKEYRKSWGTLTPHVDILNVYNRRNVLFYFFDYAATPATRSGISMFPVLPTIGLEVRF
jgi:hypothetical protein